MKGGYSIQLLIASNFFMTFSRYGNLPLKKWNLFYNYSSFYIITTRWLMAFFEFIFKVPDIRSGYKSNGRLFKHFQLKITQEVITLCVFTVCTLYIFKTKKFKWNYLVGLNFITLSAYFVFEKMTFEN